MTPTPALTSGNMSVLILIRMMHDHISRTLLINLSLRLNKNHTMKAHGGVEAWLHAFLPVQLCAPAATYLAPVPMN